MPAPKNSKIDLSISILSFNTKPLLEQCLYSIYSNTKNLKLEIFVVDNGSKDGTPEMVSKKFPQVKLIRNSENLLFTKAHNQALRQVQGQYFLILNEDTLIPPSTFEKMIDFVESNPKIGLASCKEIDEEGSVDLTCSKLPHPLFEFFESAFLGKILRKIIYLPRIEKELAAYRYAGWDRKTVKEVDVIPGSFFMGRKEVLDSVGLFDENLWLFYEEPDFCQRAQKAGFLTYHNGKVTITHLKTKAIAKLPEFARYQIAEHDMLAYYKKYFGVWWWLFLWIMFRPNWLFWRIHSLGK